MASLKYQFVKPIAGSITVLICCVVFTELLAAEVWDGPPISIVKENGQQTIDNITPGVSLTRGGSAGVYNPVRESSWTAVSPRGTAWAFAGINGNPDDANFAASNFDNLTFDTWLLSLGGTGMAGANIENRRGVLHLIDEDIYIDILFTFWESGPTEEGNFTYTRSSQPALLVQAVPVPAATLGILLITLVGLNWRIARRSK